MPEIDYKNSELYEALVAQDMAKAQELCTSMQHSRMSTSNGSAHTHGTTEPYRDAHDVNYRWNNGGETALHAAARCGADAVKLLLDNGADPALPNERGQVPFSVSSDKDARNAFRRFMAEYPDKWDYTAANVPSPLTAEMEEKQAAKAKADKKRAKEAKKRREKAEKDAQRKAEEAKAAAEAEKAAAAAAKRERDAREKREKAMTPRERAAAAALARHGAAGGPKAVDPSGRKCDFCGQPMPLKGGFEKLNFVYCQALCMREHKPDDKSS